MTPRAFAASPWDDESPLYGDEHRALARSLEAMKLEGDADLGDPSRVGRRLGELGFVPAFGW